MLHTFSYLIGVSTRTSDTFCHHPRMHSSVHNSHFRTWPPFRPYDGGDQGSRIRKQRIIFSERYVRTLTYSILAYVNMNRIVRKQRLLKLQTGSLLLF